MTLRPKSILKVVIGLKIALLTGVLLSLSGGVYIGDKPLSAAPGAEETKDDASKAEEGPAQKSAEEPSKKKSFLASLLDLPPLDPDSLEKEEIGRYLELAERKQRQIEERLTLLKTQEQRLVTLENSIEEKLVQLDQERKYFAQTLQREKELKGKRLDRLVGVYAKMEPKKAAPVMEQMDKDLVVALWKAIPQKQVMNVLQAMSPEKSVELSEYYGRVRSAREYDLLKEMNKSLLKEFEDCKQN